ncbi:MAG TPA: DUF4157 domain-containing protein, partial [Terracidiphilus sp.]|nr:DUF4157 domain-containing protein [Terracidiphilus sp.]
MPKVAKPPTKAAANPASDLAQQRSTPVVHQFPDPVEQPLFLQPDTGNKARPEPPPNRNSSDRGNAAVPEASRRASWDFRKVPTFPPRRTDLPGKQFAAREPQTNLSGAAPFRLASELSPIAAPPIVHEALRSPGQPLDAGIRAFMEPRFGYDLSGVRVHSGTAAERSARDINANAYTVGQNIVFGAGQYAPHQAHGRKLLAHELAHVIQQGRAELPTASQGNCEQDAEDAAGSLGSGNALVVRTSAVSGTVQRQAATEPIAGQASQKKSRLVRIERYWRSPSARAFFEDGSNEEVTFVEGSSLDPATQPEGPFEKVVHLTIDRSSSIRPHVDLTSHASGSKVKVVTRLSPADRIAKLPANVRGEVSEAFLS